MSLLSDSYRVPQKFGSYEFNIRDWLLVPRLPGQGMTSPVFSIGTKDSWQLVVYPGGTTDSDESSITVVLQNMGQGHIRATCELFLRTSTGELKLMNSTTPAFRFGCHGCDDPSDKWVATVPISFDYSVSSESEYMSNGTMTFVVDVTVVDNPELVITEGIQEFEEFQVPTLSSDLRALLNQPTQLGIRSDVTLASGETRVPCHQCILSARSSVFREQFMSSSIAMKRMLHAGKLYVSKIDPAVLHEFICFLYTDECNPDMLQGETLTALFSAACKYKVNGLRDICEREITRTLTIDSAADMLALADRLQAPVLKQHCVKFIGEYTKEVSGTEGFKALDADLCRLVLGEVTAEQEMVHAHHAALASASSEEKTEEERKSYPKKDAPDELFQESLDDEETQDSKSQGKEESERFKNKDELEDVSKPKTVIETTDKSEAMDKALPDTNLATS